MKFSVRNPSHPLRGSVAKLWYWRDYAKPHGMERLMPNGEMTLVVNLHDDAIRVYDSERLQLRDTLRGAVLVGAYSSPSVIDAEEQKHVFGIQFHAGGAWPFFRPSADELSNAHLALSELWRGADLRGRLLECGGDVETMFDAAESFLLARLARTMHPAVAFAARELQRRPQPVGDLVDATGLSSRRFIQLFKEQTGLTPKVFGRLQRFQRAIRAAHGVPEVDWASVALDAGYYDQSHLTRDFREFAGMTPGLYARSPGEHPNHVPVFL